MAPVTEEDRVRVKALLTEAVTVLCKDALRPDAQMNIEGLLGITVDCRDIILVNINETVYAEIKTDNRRKSPKGGKRSAKDNSSPGRKTKAPKAKRVKKEPVEVPLEIVQPHDHHNLGDPELFMNSPIHGASVHATPARATPPAKKSKEPKSTPKSKQKSKKKRIQHSSPYPEETRLTAETINDIQKTIVEQEGCVVLSRILQRRKNKFCASDLIHCMRDMSRGQSDQNYVGEYKEIGNVKIFYKCPPELIQAEALQRYSISLQDYSDLYYHDFKPNSGCPTDWLSYVATVIAHTPYNPMLFPIDSMGIDVEEKKLLISKQLERQREFQDAANRTDSDDDDNEIIIPNIKEEPEDLVDHLSGEVSDTPGVSLSLTMPTPGSTTSPLPFHGNYPHVNALVEQTVNCHEIIHTDDGTELIETETVIEDSLIMDIPDDYDSP